MEYRLGRETEAEGKTMSGGCSRVDTGLYNAALDMCYHQNRLAYIDVTDPSPVHTALLQIRSPSEFA